ncbi:exopolysaccharide biosynthesis protein [Gayadomonas joobiniege]|uniref:exopolysaccharide biosynthesis protein n=1 Tax=Gayadomonas joobiniege TaxID=1234606 RepID=UPI00035C51DA|nr:exopolysaccharide biosynthesis protein [Gayadomonas joobiniege]
MANRKNLTDILESIEEAGEGRETSVGELLDEFSGRGFGPLLIFPALIALLPSGGIPGVPTVCGVLIFLISVQLTLGRKSPWIPKKLKQISIEQKKLEKSMQKSKSITRKIDKVFKPRFEFFQNPTTQKLIAMSCAITGLLMIPLELLPFAVAIPASAITCTALGLTTEDGLVLSLGLIMSLVSIVAALTVIL